ncbi:hypothetical protein LTS10_002616 [Elasticomyces elasticus]|nr:hypothetical protein LTS10_002616 [Elasticomyces elasticus]
MANHYILYDLNAGLFRFVVSIHPKRTAERSQENRKFHIVAGSIMLRRDESVRVWIHTLLSVHYLAYSMANLFEPAREVLRMIVDLGSGYLKIAAQISRNGQPFEEIPPERIPLKAGTSLYELEQVLVFDGETLICGESEVKKWEARNPDKHDKIIESPKLCLCRKYRDSETAKRVWVALGAKHGDMTAIVNLFADQLEWCRETVFAHYRTGHTSSIHPRTSWDDIAVETVITVPCNWDDEARGIIRNAAFQAIVHDYDKINIAYEPVCAAASDMEVMRKANDIKYNDKVLFLDLGKSTVDLGPVQMREGATNGLQLQFHLAGKPYGEDAGAQDVNETAWKHVQSHPNVLDFGGDLEGVCDRLGNMEKSDFYRRFNNTFERVKRHFPNDEEYHITISARHGWQHRRDTQGRPCQAVYLVTLTREEMETIYRTWLDRLVDIITQYFEREGQDQDDCRVVMLTGMSKGNEYVTGYLHRALVLLGRTMYISKSDSPVTIGGLPQYPKHAPAARPAGYFYSVRSELWQPRLPEHKDAIDFNAEPARKKGFTRKKPQWKAEPHPNLSVVDEITGEPELLDRLANLMSILPGAEPDTKAVPMEFHVDVGGQGRLALCVYHCYEEQREHGPLRNNDGAVKPCFAQWPLQFVDLPDSIALRRIGFVPRKSTGDASYFVISGIVNMLASHDRLEIRVRLLKPDIDFKYARRASSTAMSEQLMPVRKDDIFFDQIRDLWHEDRAHTVLNGHGQHTLPTGPTTVVPLPRTAQGRPRIRKRKRRQSFTTTASGKHTLPLHQVDEDYDDEEVLPYSREVKSMKSTPIVRSVNKNKHRTLVTTQGSASQASGILRMSSEAPSDSSDGIAARVSGRRRNQPQTRPHKEKANVVAPTGHGSRQDFEVAERLRIMNRLGLPFTAELDKVVRVWRMLRLSRDPTGLQELRERAVRYVTQDRITQEGPAMRGTPKMSQSPEGIIGA